MKREFLDELRNSLVDYNVKDIDEVIAYFDEMIEDKKDEGISEEEIISSLKDTDDIARSLKDKDDEDDIYEDIEDDEDECTYTIPLNAISEISLEDIANDLEVVVTNDKEITFIYPKKDEHTFDFIVNSRKLKIDRKAERFFTNFKMLKKGNTELHIPSSFNGELKIELVSGNVEISSINLNKLNIETVSGSIYLDDIKANEVKLDSVSGCIEGDSIDGFSLKAETVSGHIDLSAIRYNMIKLDSLSGAIDVDINAASNDYAIKVELMTKDIKERMNLKKQNYLKIESMSGNVNYEFNLD